MDAIIVIVLLKYSRTQVAENPVSLSLGDMTRGVAMVVVLRTFMA